MRILFRLNWLKRGAPPLRAFKKSSAYSLFQEYVNRLGHYAPVKVLGGFAPQDDKKTSAQTWLCSQNHASRELTSEGLARKLERLHQSGVRELHIVVGGPDGFTDRELKEWNPDFHWSFGPLTLPHELAAIVASEQIYRAWTILRGLPYHTSHEK